MLEAMALGKVVIGTKGNSFDEFIEDGVSGILVESNNSIQLCRALERVWNMKEQERINIGKVAQQSIASLSPEIACRKLEEYFQQFVKSQ